MSEKFFFIEIAECISEKGININADLNGIGILVPLEKYKMIGNVWSINGRDYKIRHGYTVNMDYYDFEPYIEYENCILYSLGYNYFDDEKYESEEEANNYEELYYHVEFFVKPYIEADPYTPCYRFNNISDASRFAESLKF